MNASPAGLGILCRKMSNVVAEDEHLLCRADDIEPKRDDFISGTSMSYSPIRKPESLA